MTKICRGPAGESPAAHERTCPTEQRNQPVTQERETSMIPQKQILVVEDNLLNREMLCDILSQQYSVLEAGNGQEALALLRECGERVALILLDVMMPVMDGYTFLGRIKADPALAPIPVIVMTQSDSEADEIAALSHGATDFVPKPYRPGVILHRVASIINLRETAAMINLFQYDRLTGLYSKEFFYRKVQQRLQEDPEGEYCIVCSNIENFKFVNDALGMKAGDELLKEIAQVTKNMIGEDGFCSRFTADRFLCFLSREQEAKDRANCGSFEGRHASPMLRSLVMRWGIYEITDRTLPVEQMCDRAMLAVNSIKGQYNRHFALYDEHMRDRLLREQFITDEMEKALAEKQFLVYLQPKYSVSEDRLVGAEALVRWRHPTQGFMSPGDFIPLFEKNGFITRLDQYMWERVCELISEWKRKGYPLLPVSVNVSRADVYRADLIDTLMRITEKHGIEPELLHLEITESAYTDNPGQIISTVDQLRELGFVIEMDDFGSGYSSLNMLNQMKLDILKLDMKFIQTETAKPLDQGILRFIVSLARWMNLSVVAEGVETREQLDRLREIGCDYVQGYFFSRPLPSAEYEQMLQALPAGTVAPVQRRKESAYGLQTLLLVDEDSAGRAQLAAGLADQYRVLEADSAGAAMALLCERERPVSVILLSMTMPENGAESLLTALRRDPVAWRTPVLATAPFDAQLEERALNLDADDFVYQPATMRSLKKRLSRLLGWDAFQKRERRLQEEACRDYLTGLYNRRGLSAAMSGFRQEDLPLALYLFDLDGLKEVNDRLGHEAGDQMIRAFAGILQKRLREVDVLSRYGGDEFVVILRHIGSMETAMKVGLEICEAFRQYALPNGGHTSCSAGIALCGVDEKPTEQLIRRADEALYRAKADKRGGCCVWGDQSAATD